MLFTGKLHSKRNVNNNVIKIKTGDYVQFGKANLFAGTITEVDSNQVTVQINEWQTAIIRLPAILFVNNRVVGENKLAVA